VLKSNYTVMRIKIEISKILYVLIMAAVYAIAI